MYANPYIGALNFGRQPAYSQWNGGGYSSFSAPRLNTGIYDSFSSPYGINRKPGLDIAVEDVASFTRLFDVNNTFNNRSMSFTQPRAEKPGIDATQLLGLIISLAGEKNNTASENNSVNNSQILHNNWNPEPKEQKAKEQEVDVLQLLELAIALGEKAQAQNNNTASINSTIINNTWGSNSTSEKTAPVQSGLFGNYHGVKGILGRYIGDTSPTPAQDPNAPGNTWIYTMMNPLIA